MITIERCKRVRDAHGAICRDCGQVFELANCQFWHWRKSQAMHESGTGHRMDLFRIEVSR